ncbi:MAG: ribonuclease E/G [Bdellovibrionales bacterium]
MVKRMLIDGTHPEETRVAIVEGERLEEYEYESAFRKPLKGNIFLAKVTRVEPSLQAAFVNFGGNRHGFLPFSEIHPDYFRIPISDREALMAEHEEEIKALQEAEEAEEAAQKNKEQSGSDDADQESDGEEPHEDEVDELGGEDAVVEDLDDDIDADDDDASNEDRSEEDGDDIGNQKPEEPSEDDDVNGNIEGAGGENDDGEKKSPRVGRGGRGRNNQRGRGGRGRNNQRGRGRRHAASGNPKVESFGGDNMDDEQRFRFKMRRKYKIQEVIKRGQIMLIQVSKEERGNKGAAVGSYLSLPGRYCVLMPNSPRAGGISRKISNYKDRAKMRDLLKDLEVPQGMSVILRTAGVTRTKAEVKRDLEYLMRLWNNIRELTLESSAPAMVYEEANLVQRAVRDLYTRDVEEIVIAGDESYKSAKNFMKMMIPSHVKKVKEFKEGGAASLYKKYGIERQITEIGETNVTLKSGGYLVINPTEALVSVDVNSGKATKERNIEDTALKTNLEAADEVARQLRLRDLGGLVVIDFIDMEHRGNNAKVERRMREALSGDRARIQMGRISSFGLMEMSRQRMNPSLGESQFETCPHCEGTGRIRTADAASVMLLRAIEEEAVRGRAAQVIVHVANNVALYLLNQKRENLSAIETQYGLDVLIRVDDDMGSKGFRVEVSKPLDKSGKEQNKDQPKQIKSKDNHDDDDSQNSRRRGRRGGRRRGGRGHGEEGQDQDNKQDNAQSNNDGQQKVEDKADVKEQDKPKRGRKKKSDEVAEDVAAPSKDVKSDAEEKPQSKSKPKSKKAPAKSAAKDDAPAVVKGEAAPKAADKSNDADKPKKKAPAKKPKASNDDAGSDNKPADKPVKAKKEEPPVDKDYETVNEAPKKKKKGWWSK